MPIPCLSLLLLIRLCQAWCCSLEVSVLSSESLDPGSVPSVAMLDVSFTLAPSAIHVIMDAILSLKVGRFTNLKPGDKK